jgi:hypothetical protein
MEIQSISGADVIPTQAMSNSSEVRREAPPAESSLNSRPVSAESESKGANFDRYA